ncbi:MAG: DUF3800 domain-containing protein [Planctomycetota bacterium]
MALYHVFTDESGISDRFMLIGGLWMPATEAVKLRAEIAGWRVRDNMARELKWGKVSVHRLEEYKRFVDLFFGRPEVRFGCIVIEQSLVDHKVFNDGDAELGFYKFYFLLVSRRSSPRHRHIVYTDERTNAKAGRLTDLQKCVNAWHFREGALSRVVRDVQPVCSKTDDLIQLADVLLGAVMYRAHDRSGSPAKVALAEHIEARLGRQRLDASTSPLAKKFNVWRWRPAQI